MLSFKPEQIERLDEDHKAGFGERLAEFLEENGLLAPRSAEDPMRQVDDILEMTRRFQFTREISAARYAILACLFGLYFETLSDRAWYAQLRRGRDEEVDPGWIDRVFTTITTELESEGGR